MQLCKYGISFFHLSASGSDWAELQYTWPDMYLWLCNPRIHTSCDEEVYILVMYGAVTQLPGGGKPVEFSGKSGRE